MATIASCGVSIVRATLLATTALVCGDGVASARVGVTSATDGDPLGKPPQQVERVLRIGIDVQANELITTNASDRAHLVFLDGSSLTVGPNARLTIDKFVFDPNTKTGELAINASKGVLRLVGGKISKTAPIIITTPASTIGIRGGITILTVEANRTSSTFVFGKSMTVTAAGQTQTVTRQGSQVTTTSGSAPGVPRVVPPGGYTSQLSQLEGGGASSGPSSSGAPNADQLARSSGFSGENASRQPAAVQPRTSINPWIAQNVANANVASNALTNAGIDQQQLQAVEQRQVQQTAAVASPVASPSSLPASVPATPPSTPNPSSSPSPTPAPTPTPIATPAPTPAPGPTPIPAPSPMPSPTPGPIATPAPTPTPNPTPSPTPAPTPTPAPPPPPVVAPPPPPLPPTQVIVTRGRFSEEPAYTNFNNQTLAATAIPGHNQALQPTGTVSNGTATIALADGRSFTVPWVPGTSPYAISLTHTTLGPLNGTGFVSPTGDYFAFVFTDGNARRVGFAGGTPTTLAQFPAAGFATHVLTTLGTTGTLPWAPPSIANDAALKGAANISPLYSAYHPNAKPVVGGPALSSAGAQSTQTTVAIAGLGAAQKSYVGTFIGDYFKDFNVDSTFNSGAYYATYRGASGQTISRATSSESTFDVGDAHSIFGPNAERMLYSPSSYRSTTVSSGGTITSGTTTFTYQASLDQPYNNLSGVDYRQNTLATKTDNAAALAASRTSQSMTGGYVGGIVEQSTATGSQSTRTVGVSGALPGHVSLQTDAAANRVVATITVNQWGGSGTSATFNLGGIQGGRLSTQAFINDKIYALRDRPAENFGTDAVAQVTKNGNTSTGTDVTARTNMVSFGAAPVDSFFAAQGVTPCTCEFMTWGWWSGEIRYGNNSVYNPSGRDRLHLASYVAGVLTPTLQMPTTGVATFSGHAVGNVQNGANAYVAAGTFTKVWDFAAGSGAVTIANFDGATYTGTARQVPGVPSSQYNGALAGGGRTGSLTGSFFTGGAVPAKGTGGSFNINGPGYTAGGVFAGQR